MQLALEQAAPSAPALASLAGTTLKTVISLMVLERLYGQTILG